MEYFTRVIATPPLDLATMILGKQRIQKIGHLYLLYKTMWLNSMDQKMVHLYLFYKTVEKSVGCSKRDGFKSKEYITKF